MPKQVSGILTGNIRVLSKFFLCACFEVKTITSNIEHNSIWTDHSIIQSYSRFIKNASQCKQECKSNPKPIDSSNYPHQIPNHPEKPNTFSFGKRAVQPAQVYKCQNSTTGHWPQNTPPQPLQLSAGKLIKKNIISRSLTLLIHRAFGKGRTSQKIKIWPNPTLFYLKIAIWDGTAASTWETASISGYPLAWWKRGEYAFI